MKLIPFYLVGIATCFNTSAAYEVKPLSANQAREYKLDTGFYKKATEVQDILIVTSGKVADLAHHETAYQFDMLMRNIKPPIAEAIRKAHEVGIKIGICGQAPSNYPEFAEFLVEQGIDSISLNPDSFVKTVRSIAKTERGDIARRRGACLP